MIFCNGTVGVFLKVAAHQKCCLDHASLKQFQSGLHLTSTRVYSLATKKRIQGRAKTSRATSDPSNDSTKKHFFPRELLRCIRKHASTQLLFLANYSGLQILQFRWLRSQHLLGEKKKHLQNPATKTWDGQNTSKYYNQNGISTTDGRNFSNNRLDGTTKFHSSNEGMRMIASLIQSYYGWSRDVFGHGMIQWSDMVVKQGFPLRSRLLTRYPWSLYFSSRVMLR